MLVHRADDVPLAALVSMKYTSEVCTTSAVVLGACTAIW
jgi:hypothetical protein